MVAGLAAPPFPPTPALARVSTTALWEGSGAQRTHAGQLRQPLQGAGTELGTGKAARRPPQTPWQAQGWVKGGRSQYILKIDTMQFPDEQDIQVRERDGEDTPVCGLSPASWPCQRRKTVGQWVWAHLYMS